MNFDYDKVRKVHELSGGARILEGRTFHEAFVGVYDKSWEDLGQAPRSSVLVKNKLSGEFEEKEIFRAYRSYGATPAFDPGAAKSYMFAGSKGQEICSEIPSYLQPALDWAKKWGTRYNQLVQNVYRSGEEYIEPHRDCDRHMVDDYAVMVVSLYGGAGQGRWMDFYGACEIKPELQVPARHRSVIAFNQAANRLYRHGVSRGHEPRVSLTFRMMKEPA